MVGAMVTGNTESNITVTYKDDDGTLDFSLNNTTVTAGSYGSTSSIPTFTVDAQGRLTNVTSVSVATQLTIGDDNLDTDTVNLLSDTLTFSEGEGINAVVTDNKVTISAELASDTNKGVASFSIDNFLVSNGVVTIKDDGVILGTETTGNYVSGVSGTTNEIEVTHTPGEGSTATIGLPDDVTITNNLNVGNDVNIGGNLDVTGNAVIDGNLTVSGTTTTVNTQTVTLADNIILLNSDETSTPTQNGGIEIERGTSTNVQLRWNETNDYWQAGEGNDPVYSRIATAGWLNVGGGLDYNSSTGEFKHTDTSAQGNVANTGNTYIQSMSVDTYGHVTDITSGTVSIGDGQITITGADDITVTSGNFSVNQTSNTTIQIDHDDITRTNTTGSSSPGFGGTFTLIDSLTSSARGHVTGSNTTTITLPALPTLDNYVSWTAKDHDGTEYPITSGDILWFKEGSGIDVNFTADDELTITNTDLGSAQAIFKTITVEDAAGSVIANLVADNNNDTLYVRAGGGISLGGDANTDRLTIAHLDTSSQASVNNSGRTYIQDVTLDEFGHVTSLTSATETVVDTNKLTTFIVQDDVGAGTNVTISHGKYWKFRNGGGLTIDWTDTNSGASSDPYDLTFTISSSISAGNGLTGGGQLNANRTLAMSGSYTGSFSATGDITAYSSDKRLKQNLVTISDPIEKIKSIGGYTYTWNKEVADAVGFVPIAEEEHGVIAQEIQRIVPDAVAPAPFDTDEDGNSKSGDNYLTVRYERLVPLLIEAIKDQQAQIDDLREEIRLMKE